MHNLMKLPYSFDALEPYIDSLTVETHYAKHHQTYVTKLNAALENFPQFADKDLVNLLQNLNVLPQEIQVPVLNNGGQVYNHNIYWESMSPDFNQQPEGELLEAINQTFGSLDKFKEEFSNLGVNQFGSGWAWLSVDENKKLIAEKTSNADSPIMHGKTPILTMDVWEHAYYLKYKNLRPDYIKAFWNVVNWQEVNKKYLEAVN